MKAKQAIFSVTLILFTTLAQAWEKTGVVQKIEPTYMPDKVLFTLNVDIEGCQAGNWYTFTEMITIKRIRL